MNSCTAVAFAGRPQRQRHRAGGVPAQVDDVEGEVADVDGVAVGQEPVGITGSGSASSSWAAVGAPVASATASSACQWSKCWWVVTIKRQLRGVFSDQFDQQLRGRWRRR